MKYKILKNERKEFLGTTLSRIECVEPFNGIEKGEKGGYIEKEENLDQSGDAKVSGDAWVSGNAKVSGDAWEKSPFQLQGTLYFVCTPKKGVLKIGCHELTFDEWNAKGLEIAKKEGFTEAQIKEYQLYLDLAIELEKIK